MSERDSSPEPMDNGRSSNGHRSDGSDASEGGRSPRPVGRSRSRSRSPDKRKRRSRSRSFERRSRRDGSPAQGPGGDRLERRRSRSPGSSRSRRPNPDREAPPVGRCLGIFGLSIHTHQRDLEDVFGKYGPIEDVKIVFDAQTGRSRGFAFVYFKDKNDAQEAKDRCNGIDINGRQIRVDFSLTQRAHTPTPGIYMGRPSHLSNNEGGRREGGGRRDGGDRGGDRGFRDNGFGRDRRSFRDGDRHQRRRSPSPHYRGGGRDHRSSPPRSRYHR